MRILLFFWEIPQIMLGFVIRIFTRGTLMQKRGRVCVFSWPLSSSISLGWFCFVPRYASDSVIAHELGHTIQSLYLGPLYLVVVGLPSFVWATLFSLRIIGGDYFSFYTEKWAEKLSENFKKAN